MSAILAPLDALRRLFDWIVLVSNAVASGWIFVLMLLVTVDITMRFVFGAPISGVTEIVEISIVTILYLQLAHTLKVGRITRSDAFYGRILAKWPVFGNFLGILFHLAGVGLMIAIVVGGWPKWIQAYDGGHFVGNTGVFTFPEWPQRLVLVVGCAMLGLQFALMALDNVRGMMGLPPLEHEAAIDIEVEAVEESQK
ncbi:MAG: TRAP transporter small permease [Alphaproteobacteria bacterium]|nr:TRAP transporter small permease [Alphaproteobacteria bacterium]